MKAQDRTVGIASSTEQAKREALLAPRFYTTDFAAMNKLNLDPVRSEWDGLMNEFRSDANHDHFQRDDAFLSEIKELPPELYKEFLGFLISSITSEYSGCILYKDIQKAVDNPDVKEVMAHMARDESRHAGFLNKCLDDYDMPVNLGFLRKAKKYKYFKPKFIFYATYLSEKIGYARYITIFRQLERNPELRFHPIFRWFHDWCNDEFRHGEVFALIMRADPKLLRGHNKLWIRFFLLAVFATMYVRDHERPELHAAMGLNPTDYDREVLKVTSTITQQIFPIAVDLDNPKFWQLLDELVVINQSVQKAHAEGGLVNRLRRVGLGIKAATIFARLYTMPMKKNELPSSVRLAPTW